MKKLLCVLLTLAMLFSLVPAGFAEEIEIVEEQEEIGEIDVVEPAAEEEKNAPIDYNSTHSGSCGENVTWAVDMDLRRLTISGTGAMDNYNWSTETPWEWLSESIDNIVIENGVTSIGGFAFHNLDYVTSVSIPASVTNIPTAEGAFRECSRLTSISVASGNSTYKSIGGVVFSKDGKELVLCPEGKTGSYSIPSGVTVIRDYAFFYCMKLTGVTIPDSVTSIGSNAFCCASGLTGMTIPNSVTSIGDTAFLGCTSMKSATLPNKLTSIDYQLFCNCSALTSITIPDSVTSIGTGAFRNCRALKSVTIPKSVKTIEGEAFQDCTSLTSITIPAGVRDLDVFVFRGCKALKEIRFMGAAPGIGTGCFTNVTATAYYAPNAGHWYDYVRDNYGGEITWVPCDEIITGAEPLSATLPVKETKNLFALGPDNSVPDVTWSSSNTKVATVNSFGIVTAKKYGNCTITARTEDGGEAVCQLQTLFWDVANPSKYYFKHVYWAAEKEITKGYNLEYFAPQEECTREQMMTFLWRLAGQPEPETTSSPFPDVKSGAYYYKAVLWGVEKGITNGYSSGPYAGKFGVSVSCTREQAMTFLWRMANKPEPQTTTNKFKDVKSSDYFYKAVLWASENGIANGYSDGTYGVGLACLREHMVTFLSRYAEKFL